MCIRDSSCSSQSKKKIEKTLKMFKDIADIECSNSRKFQNNYDVDANKRSLKGINNQSNWMKRTPIAQAIICLLYTSPSPRDLSTARMPSSA
eukprot:TRINITY_DN10676_c0_g1_i1.p1 TRINITY_DN10676_c0_g1~~TRINITY_DN10676_c0_g1_i1.p1  ORF type:complete len:101 (-),score=51.41 TRINITY_DN10676_c0_g1_i1:7-282(-)